MTGQDLKNSILQLAIQGKLVAQDANDEPASVLLEMIKAEKKKLIEEKKIKKEKPLAEITEDEKPFEIPDSWVWVRFGTVTYNRDYERIPLSVGERSSLKKIYDYYGASGVIDKVDRFIFDKPLLLIGEDGANLINRSTPIAFIARGKYWVNNHAHVLDYINEDFMKYVCLYINAISLVDYVTGTAQPKMNQEKMNSIPLAIPPLSEQKRIVAKIEELMPLVDEYDKAQKEFDALNNALPEQLKQSILQEAIMGKLGTNNPDDEPASELLKRIRKEKEQLIKDKKIKKEKPLPEITEDEIPFEIPDNWVWCRLGEICSFLSRGKSPKYSDVPNLYPVFAQKCNLKEGGISLEQARFLNPETLDKWQEEYKLKTDDILVNSTGTGTVCRTRLFHEKYLGNYPFTLPDSHVSVVRTFEKINSSLYFYILNSKYIQDYWEERLAGSTNQKELYIGTLENTLIPLPPLAEQHRIVEKLENLFAYIEPLAKDVK